MTQDDRPTLDYKSPSEELSGLRDLLDHQPRLALWLGAAVLVVATLLAYIPAMRAQFIWDDDYYLTDNPLLTNLTGLNHIWFDIFSGAKDYPLPQYYPMTYTSFWLEYHLWGLNPVGYHVVNIALHIGCALLIWLILRKLRVPGAWLAATIFAIHPMNVESVAWVAERKNVLSFLFYLGALYVYLRYAGIIEGKPPLATPAGASPEPKAAQIEWFTLPGDPQRLLALAWVLFGCALLSKTIANSMPAIVLLLIWWKRRRITSKDILPLLPMFAVGILLGLLTSHMEKVRVGVGARPWLWQYAPTALGDLAARCQIAGHAIWFYVLKIIYPHPLIFNYPRWHVDPGNLIQYGFLVAVIQVVVGLALSRKRIGDGPLVAVLYFLITLFPALGFFNVWPMQYAFVADHFVYFSGIGLIALIAAVLSRYLSMEILATAAAAAVLLLVTMTSAQTRPYHDPRSLWEDTITRTDQKSWFAMNNYGMWLMDNKVPEDPDRYLALSEEWFKKVLKVYNEEHRGLPAGERDYPEAWLNLAAVAQARAQLVMAGQMAAAPATNPSTQPTTQATTRPTNSFDQQAIDAYHQAIKADPNFIKAHYDLGMLLLEIGQNDQAIDELKNTIDLDPKNISAREALAGLAYRQGHTVEAIQRLSEIVSIVPESAEAHARLGTVLLENGHLLEGLTEWDEAQKLAPDDIAMLNAFGVKMADSGQFVKAADYFHQALKIDPNSTETLTNLGVEAAKAGFPVQARNLFEQGLKVDPTFIKARLNLDALNSGRLRPTTTRSSATRPAPRAATQNGQL